MVMMVSASSMALYTDITEHSGHFLTSIARNSSYGQHEFADAAATLAAPDPPALARRRPGGSAGYLRAHAAPRRRPACELGYPVQAHRGVDGGYQLAPGAALPPLVVDDEEAVALAVGMQAAANSAVPGIEETAVRALTKVVQVMPPRLRRRVDALRAMTVPAMWGNAATAPVVDPGVLITVAQACRDTERLRFGYTTREGAQTARHVEPHRLVPLGRRWYLVAYDLARHDWRSFRLDRLSDPRGTAVQFATRNLPTADAAAFVKAGIESQRAPYSVKALVHAPADAVRERVGWWGTVTDAGGDQCLLAMTSDTLDWPTMALGVAPARTDRRY
jgi:predicted DNA-binding transcriptional regulator YafY